MNRSRRGRRGGAALEFALVLPLLLGFVLAGLDLARFVAQVQRASAAASAAADLATQIDRFSPETDMARIVTGRELAVLALAATEAAHPQPLINDGAIIITSIANSGGGPAVAWQRRWGRPELPSLIGTGNTGGISVAAGEGVIFAEIVISVRPWLFSGGLLGLPPEMLVRRTAVRRPRLAIPVIG
jgi:Flp pilus assembly protein TadG